MNAPVFVSYSSKDQEAAETICSELESRQLKCWIATRDIDPGDNFQEAITKAIRNAKVMILIFTKNSNDSGEIKNELALASQHQLAIIPVRVDDVTPNDALAYALATRQWIDLFRDSKAAIDRLASRAAAIASIELTTDAKGQPDNKTSEPPAAPEESDELPAPTSLAEALGYAAAHMFTNFVIRFVIPTLAIGILFIIAIAIVVWVFPLIGIRIEPGFAAIVIVLVLMAGLAYCIFHAFFWVLNFIATARARVSKKSGFPPARE